MKDFEIDRINAERRRRGLPPLTKGEARSALSSQPAQSDDSALHFLIGYTTGFPMPSGAGVMGALLHSSSAASEPSYSAPDPSPSYSSNDSSSSYDSGSSSSDSGSSGGGGGGD